jgi:hypothetical protein
MPLSAIYKVLSKGIKMKKLVALVVVGVLSIMGLAHSEIVDSQDIEGYWFGNALKDRAAGMVMCDNQKGLAYLGLYSEKKIPGLREVHHCNLAISMDRNGNANMQVIDPVDGKTYNLDLLALAKNNQPKEVEETEEVEVESIEVLKAKNAELEKRIEELVAELIAIESKRGQE